MQMQKQTPTDVAKRFIVQAIKTQYPHVSKRISRHDGNRVVEQIIARASHIVIDGQDNAVGHEARQIVRDELYEFVHYVANHRSEFGL